MISFVLPVYNCGETLSKNLPELIALLETNLLIYEIIIVDDCSADDAVVKKAAEDLGCVCIRNEKNEGKGYAVRKGFERARGEYRVFMDGDFPFDLQAVLRVVTALQTAGTDMAIGDRTLRESSYPKDLPWFRKMGSGFLSALMGRYITRGYYDTQCGIKGFSAKSAAYIFPRLTQKRFSFDMEILFLATRRKLTIARVPVTVRSQPGSTVRIWKDGIDILKALFVIYINKTTGRYRFNEKGMDK